MISTERLAVPEIINPELLEKKDWIVTVYMLSYNHEKYIAQAIESVLRQDTEYEYLLLIHDDASDDSSGRIIREYATTCPDTICALMQTENQYSESKNIIANHLWPITNSKYVAYCECDDFWIDEKKIQKQVDILESHPEYVSTVGSCICINEKNEPFIHSPFTPQETHVFNLINYRYGNRLPGQTASKMVRFDLFKHMKEDELRSFLSLKSNGDVNLDLLCVLNGSIYYLSDLVSIYRKISGEGSSWTSRSSKRNMQAERYEALLDLQRFAKEFYGVDICSEPHLLKTIFRSLALLVMRRSTENVQAFRLIMKLTPGGFLPAMAKYATLSIRFVLHRILQRIGLVRPPLNYDRVCEMSSFIAETDSFG